MSRAMSRRAIASVLGTLMVTTAVSQVQASAAQAPPPLPQSVAKATAQWTLRFSGAAETNVPFSLYSQSEKEHLYYGKRWWGFGSGISLKWSSSAKHQWKFVKCGSKGTSSPIQYDQRLALYNTSVKEYMVYKKRDLGRGINLGWSKKLDKTTCQWKVRGGKAGKTIGPSPVKNAMLFNTVEKDYFVNGWRPSGVNLRWYRYGVGDQIWDLVQKGVCAAGVVSNEAKAACAAFKALEEFQKAMGYS
ncbi:hypothetical protein G9272_04975 [Streptomyces asoensis]|uniref:Uncharacterized protein n=1 Tax=Streptomyces asoensis TaxID=249586 RepID=A0A6M4WIK0_9ACTN|nr:hypothetical protein [Streptomyces asoensis]QJS99730.1 hypothetical protein G9272_04975 [Streptomyces asoensis]